MATTTLEKPVAAAAAVGGESSPPGPIYVDTQHEDLVHDTQMDYYGAKLATCSSDRTVKVYDVSETSYEICATLQGHEGPVWQVSWAHPKFGVILASCSFDGSVLIHRETRPREWTLLHAARHLHESSVNGCAFAPQEYGLQVAAASSDGKVSILQHQPNNTWAVEYLSDCSMGVNSVSWAPVGAYFDATTMAAANTTTTPEGEQQLTAGTTESPRLVTAGCDNRIRFWVCRQAQSASDTTTAMTGGGAGQQPEWVMDSSQCEQHEGSLQHTDWVRDVAWAPVMVPNTNTVASCSEDGTVLIWTQKIESPGDDNNSPSWKATLLHRFDEPVWRVSWSVTGHLLAVSSGDSNVTLWKKATVGNESKWVQMDTTMQQVEVMASPPPVAAAAGAGGVPPPPPPQG